MLANVPRMLLQGPGQPGGIYSTEFFLFVLLVYWPIVILVAFWLNKDAKRRGQNNALWVTLWTVFGLIGPIGLIVLLVYFLMRGEIKPELTMPPLQVAGSAPPMGGPTVAPAAGVPSRSILGGPPPASSPAGPMVAPPPWTPPPMSKVRCPRCQTVFEYQKMPTGPTHVKCPACGEEGNI